ncbi:MAG: hypothetical protein HY814_04060 [Candidatus Riflebacteria bacterium]|nr:hypothetical protein [Candidatus Riflebacteria bacterium]
MHPAISDRRSHQVWNIAAAAILIDRQRAAFCTEGLARSKQTMGLLDGNRFLPAIAGGVVLVIGAIGLALMGPGAKPEATETSNPYMNTLDGVMTRHGAPLSRDYVMAAQAAQVSAPTTGGAADPNRPRPPRAVSELGREILKLMGDPDILVLALSHPQGHFVFSRSRGWLTLEGNEWVTLPSSRLPADLRTRYPAAIYPDGGVPGSPGASDGSDGSASGTDGGGSQDPGGGQPTAGHETGARGTAGAVAVTEKEAAISYVPSLNLGQKGQ